MKLNQKNIEKTLENFHAIPTEGEKTQNSKLNVTSLNISQEEIIKSFDNVEYARIPTQIKTKVNDPQTPCPSNERKNQKRMLSSSSQSSSFSIDIKPSKKRANSQEKKAKRILKLKVPFP